MIISILETFQNEDGSVTIPEALAAVILAASVGARRQAAKVGRRPRWTGSRGSPGSQGGQAAKQPDSQAARQPGRPGGQGGQAASRHRILKLP